MTGVQTCALPILERLVFKIGKNVSIGRDLLRSGANLAAVGSNDRQNPVM